MKLQTMSAVVVWALASSAQASLVTLNNGAVLDTATNLVWLKDWNTNGEHNWQTQHAWADALTTAGSSDWRLPWLNELTTLFGEFGDLRQVDAFTNVQVDYWGGNFDSLLNLAGFFWTNAGGSNPYALPSNLFSAVAVRDYDAAIDVVPEPATLALVATALAVAGAAGRRRQR